MREGALFQIKNRRELVSRLGENKLQNVAREILHGGHGLLFPDPLVGSINFPIKKPGWGGMILGYRQGSAEYLRNTQGAADRGTADEPRFSSL